MSAHRKPLAESCSVARKYGVPPASQRSSPISTDAHRRRTQRGLRIIFRTRSLGPIPLLGEVVTKQQVVVAQVEAPIRHDRVRECGEARALGLLEAALLAVAFGAGFDQGHLPLG